MRFRIFIFFISVCLFACFLPAKIFAVSVSISSFPSTITQDMFSITASISGAGNGTNYLRIDLYKDGSSSYFGETFNGTDWYSGSDYHQYFPITIAGSSWNGTVTGNLGSPTSSQYDGTGTYKMRLRRYTSGGSTTSSEADASAVVIAIVTPSPTPTSMPTSAPTSTPVPTPSSPGSTGVQSGPTAINTSAPIIKPTIKPTTTPILSGQASATLSSWISSDSSVLGSSISSIPTLVEGMQDSKKSSVDILGVLLIIGGIVVLSSCGILFFREWKKKDIHENTDE